MLQLIDATKASLFSPLHFVIASTDNHSAEKAKELVKRHNQQSDKVRLRTVFYFILLYFISFYFFVGDELSHDHHTCKGFGRACVPYHELSFKMPCPFFSMCCSTYCPSLSKQNQQMKYEHQHASIHYVSRSREVGQTYLSSTVTTLLALVESFPLILRLRPELVCNPPPPPT